WQNVRRGDASRNRVTIPKSAARCKLVLPQRESRWQTCALCFHPHTFPESHVVLDFGGRFFGLRVIPGGVVVLHPADGKVVVVRGALPRAFAGMRAGFQEFLVYRVE